VIGTRLRSRGRRWSDRLRRSDRGAAAVEFALIVPVLTMLTLGILDAGLLFFKWTAIGQGARAGARAVSEQPADDYADYYALRAASAVLTAIAPEDVLRVVVYKAGPDTDGDGNPLNNPPPSSCLGNSGVTGVCNVYTAADLTASKATYAAGTRQSFWPGTSRDVWADANDTDYVGVYVAARVRPPAGVLGGTRTVSRFTVARLEPQATNPLVP